MIKKMKNEYILDLAIAISIVSIAINYGVVGIEMTLDEIKNVIAYGKC